MEYSGSSRIRVVRNYFALFGSGCLRVIFLSGSVRVSGWLQTEFSGLGRVLCVDGNYFVVFESVCGVMEFFDQVQFEFLVDLKSNFHVRVGSCADGNYFVMFGLGCGFMYFFFLSE